MSTAITAPPAPDLSDEQDSSEITDNQLELLIGTDNRPLVDTSKPELNYTAERLWRERPEIAKACVKLLAERRDNVSYRRIMRRCHVSYHTLRALEIRNGSDIKTEKKNLGDVCLGITEAYAEQALATVGTAKGKEAVLAMAIAGDKYLSFRGEATQRIDINVAVDVNAKIDAAHAKIMAEFAQMKRAQVIEIPTGALPDLQPQVGAIDQIDGNATITQPEEELPG